MTINEVTLKAASTCTSNFLLAFFDGFLKFTFFRIDETNASQSSSIVEFWLLVHPFLFFSLVSGFSNFSPYFRPHIVRSGGSLNICQSPLDHKNPFGGFSFNIQNFVHPFQESDKLRFASTFHRSSKRFSCNTSRFLSVALVTSMYCSGIGNVSSFGTL